MKHQVDSTSKLLFNTTKIHQLISTKSQSQVVVNERDSRVKSQILPTVINLKYYSSSILSKSSKPVSYVPLKVFFYLIFRSGVFRFRSKQSYYTKWKYTYRSPRMFVGTTWNACNPGYHQSYFGAIRHNHSTFKH